MWSDIVLYIARGLVVGAAITLFAVMLGVVPERKFYPTMIYLNLVGIAASLWAGMEQY